MTVYKEDRSIRIFEENVHPDDLVWHRDQEDRVVTILEGVDWQFQFEDQIPQIISPGDTINIPAMVYHRIIKGQNRLVINIERNLHTEELP